ncbi:MAG: Hsp70 family protein [Acidobacteriaceae bacterium]|nr:Hsp70 family protein [Acidobacteriaceae bacterium]
MKLGIDFGTNRIVIAAADRGNYPLISFELPDGSAADWYPSLVALRGDERRYGWDAWDTQADRSWTVVRSIKRLLEDAGPHTTLDLGEQKASLMELLRGLTKALAVSLREKSTLPLSAGEKFEAVLGVPANANTNQRFLTVEAFRAAGFQVLGVLNEPSAASIEFGHRQRQTKARSETILVYDLGGGTFDASLVTLNEKVHHVVASEGIPTIGGDDFDQILADLALEAANTDPAQRDALSAGAWFRLLDECRTKKEAIHPNTRRISVDLEIANPEWTSVTVPISAFYEKAKPLVEETVSAVEDLLTKTGNSQLEALYLTGGGSELPLVARVLRERFGKRVRRSAYARSATAIGLAIQADQPGTYRLSERLARYFGVWREADSGSRIVFDPLWEKGLSLPSPGEPSLTTHRVYSPVHNIGHFRYLECSHRAADGAPNGDVTFWDEIRFPFDPALKEVRDLSALAVTNRDGNGEQVVEELYECDSGGSISVTIANRSSNYSQKFQLGHWSGRETSVKPRGRRQKTGGAAG